MRIKMLIFLICTFVVKQIAFAQDYRFKKTQFYTTISNYSFISTKSKNETSINTSGFLGFDFGLIKYYNKNNYLNIGIGIKSNRQFPFVANFVVLRSFDTNINTNFFASFSNHHVCKKFSWGYGITLNKFRQSTGLANSFGVPDSATFKEGLLSGLLVDGKYFINKHFNVGVNFQTSFINLRKTNEVNYGHQLNFCVTHIFGFKKKKNHKKDWLFNLYKP